MWYTDRVNPLVSVVIPTFNTPADKLRRCLESALGQIWTDGCGDEIEIIVVDDSSRPSCAETIPDLAANSRIRIFRHWRNRGCLEARRTGCKKARGTYIISLDSDDELAVPDACRRLYEAAERSGADIVQYLAKNVFEGALENKPETQKIRGIPRFQGTLSGKDIFESFFCRLDLTTFLWGKCIRREVFLRALKKIPRVNCTQNEDLLISFFLFLTAHSYTTLPEELYVYYQGEGTSTARRITTLSHWHAICSAANVCKIIQKYLFFQVELEKYIEILPQLEWQLINSTLQRFYGAVDDNIQEEAWRMLCNTWGTQRICKYDRQFREELKLKKETLSY